MYSMINLKTNLFIFIILTFFVSTNGFAENYKISCETPRDIGINYFDKQPMFGTQAETFMLTDDNKPFIPTLVIEDTKGILTLKNTTDDSSNSGTVSLSLLEDTPRQVSMTGKLKGAILLVSYYPQQKILIISEHTSWPDTIGEGGVRVRLNYTKCESSLL